MDEMDRDFLKKVIEHEPGHGFEAPLFTDARLARLLLELDERVKNGDSRNEEGHTESQQG